MTANEIFQKVFRIGLGTILMVAGVTAALGTVLGFFGSLYWLFDVFGSFRAQYTIVLVIVGIVYGIIYGRTVSFVFFGAALLNVIVMFPLFFANQPDGRSDDLEIVAFNVQAGNPDRGAVMAYLLAQDADLVVLSESSTDWEDAVRRSDMDYHIAVGRTARRSFGVTLLSKEPVENFEVTTLEGVQVVTAVVQVGGESTTVIAVHPPAPTNRENAEQRDAALERVALLASSQMGPVVVVGDLNATPWSHAFRTLQRIGDLTNTQRGYGLQPTWPGDRPWAAVPIDHVLVSDELTTVARSTGPLLGSDHRPLKVTIALAK